MIQDGGPAFPITEANGANSGDMGMSLRDYFAAKALQSGWLRNTDIGYGGMTSPQIMATACYEIADAMLAARKA